MTYSSVRIVTNVQTLTLHSPAHRWEHLHPSPSFKIQLNLILNMRDSLLHQTDQLKGNAVKILICYISFIQRLIYTTSCLAGLQLLNSNFLVHSHIFAEP